jgi:hypothetical protein
MNALDVCGEWTEMSDECNCVEAAEEKVKQLKSLEVQP